jgi:hypothetical protein
VLRTSLVRCRIEGDGENPKVATFPWLWHLLSHFHIHLWNDNSPLVTGGLNPHIHLSSLLSDVRPPSLESASLLLLNQGFSHDITQSLPAQSSRQVREIGVTNMISYHCHLNRKSPLSRSRQGLPQGRRPQ